MKFLTKTLADDSVTCTLADGRSVRMNVDDLNEEMFRRAAIHGLSQKIGDAASGFSKAKDTAGAFAAMNAVVEQIRSGEWNRKGTGSGSTYLVEALFRVMEKTSTPKTLDECQAAIDGMDDDTIAVLKKDVRIVAAIKEIQAERAKANVGKGGVDLGDLF